MVVLGRVCVAVTNFWKAWPQEATAQSCRFSDLDSVMHALLSPLHSPLPVSELAKRARSVAQSAPGASEVAAQITHKRERRETLIWHRYQPSVGGYQDDGRGCAKVVRSSSRCQFICLSQIIKRLCTHRELETIRGIQGRRIPGGLWWFRVC